MPPHFELTPKDREGDNIEIPGTTHANPYVGVGKTHDEALELAKITKKTEDPKDKYSLVGVADKQGDICPEEKKFQEENRDSFGKIISTKAGSLIQLPNKG